MPALGKPLGDGSAGLSGCWLLQGAARLPLSRPGSNRETPGQGREGRAPVPPGLQVPRWEVLRGHRRSRHGKRGARGRAAQERGNHGIPELE